MRNERNNSRLRGKHTRRSARNSTNAYMNSEPDFGVGMGYEAAESAVLVIGAREVPNLVSSEQVGSELEQEDLAYLEAALDPHEESFEDRERLENETGPDVAEPEKQVAPSRGKSLLQIYFDEIGRTPLLSDEETIAVAREMEEARKRNDGAALEKAKSKLVTANLRLVVSMAKKFSHCGMPLSDLIQAGNIGLMRAADGFDYTRGFKFSTYASNWIKSSMTRMLSNQVRTVRLPINLIPLMKGIERASRKLNEELGRGPTADELARETDMDGRRIRSMAEFLQSSVSLESPACAENPTCAVGEFLHDRQKLSVAEMVEKRLFRERLEAVMNEALDEREREVLRMRYGLKDGVQYTQDEISRCLRLSRQRVSQIEKRALLRLRQHAEASSLRGYLN